jgi:hypothetical protein
MMTSAVRDDNEHDDNDDNDHAVSRLAGGSCTRRNVVGSDGVTFMGGRTIEDDRGSLFARVGLIEFLKSKSGNWVSLSDGLFVPSWLGVKVKGVRGDGSAKENGDGGDDGMATDSGEEGRFGGNGEDRDELEMATGRGV